MAVWLNYNISEDVPAEIKGEIRIVSPSGIVNPEYIDGAKAVLEEWGYKVTEGKYARAAFGRFAGTDAERLSDLQEAVNDPEVSAILCSRGGYGLSRIIDKVELGPLAENPKLLIGFSDVTFLHSLWNRKGFVSLHSIMVKHLTELDYFTESKLFFHSMLEGRRPDYAVSSNPLNRKGKVKAKLVGGNLSILAAGRGSDFEPDYKDKILFIEDIGEKSYHIDRMMQNLRFGGVLSQLSGLLVGYFTDCAADSYSGKSVYEIIREAVEEYDYPVAFGFPAGHEDNNLPLWFGVEAELIVE